MAWRNWGQMPFQQFLLFEVSTKWRLRYVLYKTRWIMRHWIGCISLVYICFYCFQLCCYLTHDGLKHASLLLMESFALYVSADKTVWSFFFVFCYVWYTTVIWIMKPYCEWSFAFTACRCCLYIEAWNSPIIGHINWVHPFQWSLNRTCCWATALPLLPREILEAYQIRKKGSACISDTSVVLRGKELQCLDMMH